MHLLDVNVLLAAHRAQHQFHARVDRWLTALLAEQSPFTVPPGVWVSFVRIATQPRVFDPPTTRDEAFAFMEALRSAPSYRELAPGPRHLTTFRRLCHEGQATGPLVPDAYLAALAVDSAATLVTFDKDFRRFDGLRTFTPPEL